MSRLVVGIIVSLLAATAVGGCKVVSHSELDKMQMEQQRLQASIHQQSESMGNLLAALQAMKRSYQELEIQAEEHDLPAARTAILELAARLNLTEQERRGYLEMLLSKK